MDIRLKKVVILIIIGMVSLSGCSSNISGYVDNDKPIVAVSIVPQKTFVEAVAGDLVKVVTMIPPGYSPANYQPSPKEMREFSKASVYFTIGVNAEKENILPKIKDFNNKIRIVSLDNEIGKVYPHRYFEDIHHDDHDHGRKDPHIWMSPKRVKVMIDIICRELTKIDPKNRDIYEKNTKEYIEKLDKLDKEIKEVLSEVENRAFIIYHPSLGYFAEDYGLNMIAVENEGKEATAKELQEIIDIAKEENIKVVFYQEEIDSSQSRTLAEEIGGRTHKLAPLAPNYIENLKKIAETFNNVLH